MKTFIKSFLISLLLIGSAFGQTASLLPNALQQYFDNNGNPLSSGTVTFYVPATSILKTTWKDSGQAVPWPNPIVLDAGGKPPGSNAGVYGNGTYRQVVRDRNGNLIWDAVTAPGGGGGSNPTLVGDGNSVGTILPWSGLVAPPHYVFAYGQELVRATYPEFFTAITLTQSVTCTISNNILTNVSDTTQIAFGTKLEVSCVPIGSTVTDRTSSTVTVNNNSNVSITAIGIFFPWGNGNGTTTFNVPDLRGRALVGRDNMGGTAASRLTSTNYSVNPDATGAGGGSEAYAIARANLPNVNFTNSGITLTDPGHLHSLSAPGEKTINQAGNVFANGGGSLFQSGSVQTILSAFTGITVSSQGVAASGGSGTALPSIQPSITLNYIIKVTPDVNISTLSVVTSLGSMTGDITCGTGIVCSGNSIAANDAGTLTYNAPVTGATITLTNVTRRLIIDPSGTISALTIVMPIATGLVDGQPLGICGTKIVTTLTMTAGSGTTISNPATAMQVPVATGAASCFEFVYRVANTTWYRSY